MSDFSLVEMALYQFMKMDAAPLVEYQELCEQVLPLLENQKADASGCVYIPKNTITKVITTSKTLAYSVLAIKSSLAVSEPASEAETVAMCSRFVQGPGALDRGDVVYFLPRCCTFRDIPPGVPFVVADPLPDVENADLSFPSIYAIELAYLDTYGAIQSCIVDRRRISREKHAVSPLAEAPSTSVVS